MKRGEPHGHCSKDSGLCVPPARPVQRLSGLVSAFGTRFSNHVQGNTTLSTDLAADPVHPLLHLAMTPMASLHRMRGRGQPLVVEQHQGFVKRRCADLLSGLTKPLQPFHPLTQLLPLAQRRLCPAAPVTQCVEMVHDRAQLASRRPTTGDGQEPLAFRWCQVALDEHKAILEHGTDFLVDIFAFACQSARLFVCGRWASSLGLRLGLAQAFALCGHRAQDPVGQILDDREETKLIGPLPTDLADRFGIECRAIGRDPLERPAALIQGRLQTPKKRCDIVMMRSVIEAGLPHPLVLPLLDGREHTGRALRECIDSRIARKRLKRPLQKGTAHVPLRLFFPQPRPSFGSWRKAQRRGDRATDARWQAGRARALRPPHARRCRSPAACHDCRVGLNRTERCCNAYDMWNSRETRRSPGCRLGDRCIHRQGRARCAGRRGGERRDGHIVGRGFADGYGDKSPVVGREGP